MLKILSRMPDRDNYRITKSPPDQYSNYQNKNKEISDEIKPRNEYENAIIVFDDFSGSTNSRYIPQSFIRGRHNNLDIPCLSQSSFDLPRRSIRNSSIKTFLFNQTLRDIEILYREVLVDMIWVMMNIKKIFKRSWEEDYNCLCIERCKKRDQGRYCISNESKSTYIERTYETRLFWFWKSLYSYTNRENLKNLEELASLKSLVEKLRWQDKLGKEKFHENIKKNLNQVLLQLKIPLKI